MDVYEVGSELLQVGELYRLVIHKGTTLTAWRYGTADNGLGVVLDIQLCKCPFESEVGDVEFALHNAGTRVVLDCCAVVLGSEQQRQGTHQNRLSGTGLARDDIERGVELDFEVLYERVVLYNQSS